MTTQVKQGMDQALAGLSVWIDKGNAHRDPEAVTWGRLAKVAEESGEVISAFIGATGQNPRKGQTHDMSDVGKELLDTAVTALAAYEHLTGNTGASVEALVAHIDGLMDRAGLARIARQHAAPDVERRIAQARVTANRLAAALSLALHDAHPTYANTTGWRGGIGGQAMTPGCSFIDPPPGDDWTQLDLLSTPLREWLDAYPDFDLHAAKAALRKELLAKLGPEQGAKTEAGDA